jgi:hypothetical protein
MYIHNIAGSSLLILNDLGVHFAESLKQIRKCTHIVLIQFLLTTLASLSRKIVQLAVKGMLKILLRL